MCVHAFTAVATLLHGKNLQSSTENPDMHGGCCIALLCMVKDTDMPQIFHRRSRSTSFMKILISLPA